MTYEIGATIVIRDFQPDGRIRAVECGRVVADDEHGTMMWIGPDSAVIRRVTVDGRPTRRLPLETKLHTPTLPTTETWNGPGALVLTPPDAAHCLWWSFDADGGFKGWYVNLQTPARRWWGGIDIEDQTLDVLVAPDRTWRWKDEEDFVARTGRPLFWNAAGAEAIRAEGRRAIALAEAGAPPFDGRWCDFRPDPAWPPTALPWWWDLPT